jgi:hypothetical protein
MRVEIVVRCARCGRPKAPIGRSVPVATWNGWCTNDQCEGYSEPPFVGSLWPNETEKDFGYPVGSTGTEER